MILRPVSPQSACGPPSSNAPVGLHEHLEVVVGELLGQQRADHVLDEVGRHLAVDVDARARAGVEISTVDEALRARRPRTRSITWVLPSGRR